jgi:CRISPR-associated protein Csm3
MRLIKYKKITGKIIVKTGLHIGGSVDVIEIQGVDNPIIKNPMTNEPYIPGSSLKGKMRSLLEWKLGKIEPNGPHQWCNDIACPICRIFGTSSDDANLGPTRVLVRDAELTSKCKDKIHKEGISLTEVKYENSIDRISARANPRSLERVSAGVEFDFEILYRVFDMGDQGKTDEELFKYVIDGLRYLQQDTLGGSGSRGSGKIAFKELKDEGGEDINLFDLEEVQDESL